MISTNEVLIEREVYQKTEPHETGRDGGKERHNREKRREL